MRTLLFRSLSLLLVVGSLAIAVHAADPTGAPVAAQTATRAADMVAGRNDGFSVADQLFGWGMLPLWFCSFLLVAFVIERFRSLRPEKVIDPLLADKVGTLMTEGKVDEAHAACVASPTVLGRAWAQGLTEFRIGGSSLVECLTTATVLHLKPLKRNLAGIATIGVICPLFGLLGTIVGMIITFTHISTAGGANKAAIAGGIAFALVKTAGGLVVAIPAIVMGRYFQGRLGALADQAESGINRVNHRHMHGRALAGEVPTEPVRSESAVIRLAGV